MAIRKTSEVMQIFHPFKISPCVRPCLPASGAHLPQQFTPSSAGGAMAGSASARANEEGGDHAQPPRPSARPWLYAARVRNPPQLHVTLAPKSCLFQLII
jgi:hypothetical protein